MNGDVAIVGAGPVGKVLALMLARYRISSTLFEAFPETLRYPRGSTFNARTMEHMRRLGLAGDLRKLGLPSDYPTDVIYLTHLHVAWRGDEDVDDARARRIIQRVTGHDFA